MNSLNKNASRYDHFARICKCKENFTFNKYLGNVHFSTSIDQDNRKTIFTKEELADIHVELPNVVDHALTLSALHGQRTLRMTLRHWEDPGFFVKEDGSAKHYLRNVRSVIELNEKNACLKVIGGYALLQLSDEFKKDFMVATTLIHIVVSFDKMEQYCSGFVARVWLAKDLGLSKIEHAAAGLNSSAKDNSDCTSLSLLTLR